MRETQPPPVLTWLNENSHTHKCMSLDVTTLTQLYTSPFSLEYGIPFMYPARYYKLTAFMTTKQCQAYGVKTNPVILGVPCLFCKNYIKHLQFKCIFRTNDCNPIWSIKP